jgi:hypothetical protein
LKEKKLHIQLFHFFLSENVHLPISMSFKTFYQKALLSGRSFADSLHASVAREQVQYGGHNTLPDFPIFFFYFL